MKKQVVEQPKRKNDILFYMDDSGSRHPDHQDSNTSKRDWFALGGILLDQKDKEPIEASIDIFRKRWPELKDHPFRSYDIRRKKNNFDWMVKDSGRAVAFLDDLHQTLLELPVIGIACVIDRPGYNARYKERYGKDRWMLCKTAFGIAVDRATKFAINNEQKLRVYVERTSKEVDLVMKGYYNTLRDEGSWFDVGVSAVYQPLPKEAFKDNLKEFDTKTKQSVLMQLADMFLWPMCIAGYDRENRVYLDLMKQGRLIDCYISAEEMGTKGIKYSCFDQSKKVEPENTKTEK